MLLSNAFRPDPRVEKEATGLVEAGYDLSIIAWDRLGQLPAIEFCDGYKVERVHEVSTIYGAGLRQLMYTPRFWAAAARRIRMSPPDIIHCHDMDTLPAGWWMKRSTGARLVYDAHENYPALMSLYLPKPLIPILTLLERFLLKNVDYVLTASSVLAETMTRLGIQRVATIGNYARLEQFHPFPPEVVTRARAELSLAEDDLTVAYIGGFSRNRLIIPLIQAVEGMEGVKVMIWGDGHQRKIIEDQAERVPNVHYMGWLPEEHVALHMQAADVIFYCLVPDYPGAIFNAPNTLSYAMAAGRPIIANDVGDLGRIVRQTGCGILLPDTRPVSIRQAVLSLCSEESRRYYGDAGRQAAEHEYNWDKARQLLVAVYSQLTN